MIKRLILLLVVSGGFALVGSLLHPFGNLPSDPQAPLLEGSHVDESTLKVIQRACQNCHSERTEWPWYSRIAPGSWMVEHDVSEARSHFNLSHWSEYPPDERSSILSEMGSAARTGVMPPSRYTLLHPEARLSSAEREQIYLWTKSERRMLRELSPKATSAPIGFIPPDLFVNKM